MIFERPVSQSRLTSSTSAIWHNRHRSIAVDPVKARVIARRAAQADLPANCRFGFIAGAAGLRKTLAEQRKIGTHNHQMLRVQSSRKLSGNLSGSFAFLWIAAESIAFSQNCDKRSTCRRRPA
jgi:hypothetical protein